MLTAAAVSRGTLTLPAKYDGYRFHAVRPDSRVLAQLVNGRQDNCRTRFVTSVTSCRIAPPFTVVASLALSSKIFFSILEVYVATSGPYLRECCLGTSDRCLRGNRCLQTICRPFRSEFDILNEMESASSRFDFTDLYTGRDRPLPGESSDSRSQRRTHPRSRGPFMSAPRKTLSPSDGLD